MRAFLEPFYTDKASFVLFLARRKNEGREGSEA